MATVPNVIGDPLSSAQTTLGNAGFTDQTVYDFEGQLITEITQEHLETDVRKTEPEPNTEAPTPSIDVYLEAI